MLRVLQAACASLRLEGAPASQQAHRLQLAPATTTAAERGVRRKAREAQTPWILPPPGILSTVRVIPPCCTIVHSLKALLVWWVLPCLTDWVLSETFSVWIEPCWRLHLYRPIGRPPPADILTMMWIKSLSNVALLDIFATFSWTPGQSTSGGGWGVTLSNGIDAIRKYIGLRPWQSCQLTFHFAFVQWKEGILTLWELPCQRYAKPYVTISSFNLIWINSVHCQKRIAWNVTAIENEKGRSTSSQQQSHDHTYPLFVVDPCFLEFADDKNSIFNIIVQQCLCSGVRGETGCVRIRSSGSSRSRRRLPSPSGLCKRLIISKMIMLMLMIYIL